MEGTPDIAKVVSLIMQNPELLESIKGMMSDADKKDSEPATDESAPVHEDASEVIKLDGGRSPTDDRDGRRKRRNTLLLALKPYVSKSRARAIDTMMTIADMLDAVKGD